MAVHGVDLSENNGAVDFAALQAAGAKFVLLRCGYGNDLAEQDDKRFLENVRKARDFGLPWGAYLYSYAMTAGEAESEAAHALRLLEQAGKPPYGVWFDMEDADGYKAARGMPSNGGAGGVLPDLLPADGGGRVLRRGVRLSLLVYPPTEQPQAGPLRQVGGPLGGAVRVPGQLRHLAAHGPVGSSAGRPLTATGLTKTTRS